MAVPGGCVVIVRCGMVGGTRAQRARPAAARRLVVRNRDFPNGGTAMVANTFGRACLMGLPTARASIDLLGGRAARGGARIGGRRRRRRTSRWGTIFSPAPLLPLSFVPVQFVARLVGRVLRGPCCRTHVLELLLKSDQFVAIDWVWVPWPGGYHRRRGRRPWRYGDRPLIAGRLQEEKLVMLLLPVLGL